MSGAGSISWFDYGFGGIFQPKMNYNQAFATILCQCTKCVPPGALLSLLPEAKRLVQMGKVHCAGRLYCATKKTDCGACSEHCRQSGAHGTGGKSSIPEVNNDIVSAAVHVSMHVRKPRKESL